MCNQLKTLSASQLKRFIKEKVDNYLDGEYTYKVKDLDTPNVNTKDNKLSFKVEIRNVETD